MRIAVLAVSEGGVRLAARLRRNLPISADIFCRKEFFSAEKFLPENSNETGGQIFFVQDWQETTGKIGATPVITTATDVKNRVAPDKIAGELFLRPSPKENIKIFNRAVLSGENPKWFVTSAVKAADFFCRELKNRGIDAALTTKRDFDGKTVLITDESSPTGGNILRLTPRRLVAGVGCRRGTSAEQLAAALEFAVENVGRPLSFVKKIVSVDLKKDEPGLLAAAKNIGAETEFFCADELKIQCDKMYLPCSPFVGKIIGVGNVADAAAVCGGGKNFALMKSEFLKLTEGKNFSFGEKVTVSLMWEK